MGFLDDLLNKVTGDSNDENLEKAENEQTSSEELTQLSESKDEDVREAVASNTNCPTSVMEKLAQDEEYSVRRGVVRNPNCPTSVLEKLASDEDTTVRESVAENSNCSNEILEILKDDENHLVVQYALHNLFERNPKFVEEVFKTGNKDQLTAIANYNGTPENLLKDLLMREDVKVINTKRKAIANKNLSDNSLKELYEKFSKDDDIEDWEKEEILVGLASNASLLSEEIFLELSSHASYEVKEGVTFNPNTPLNILVKLLDDEERIVMKAAVEALLEREEPKDEVISILEDLITNISEGEVLAKGKYAGVDVMRVRGLTETEVDYYKEAARKRIKELSA